MGRSQASKARMKWTRLWETREGRKQMKWRAPGAKAQRRKTANRGCKRAKRAFLWELVYKSHTQKIGGKVKQRWGCGGYGWSTVQLLTACVSQPRYTRPDNSQCEDVAWIPIFLHYLLFKYWSGLCSRVFQQRNGRKERQYSITIDCGSVEIEVMAYKPNLTSVYLTSLREHKLFIFRCDACFIFNSFN